MHRPLIGLFALLAVGPTQTARPGHREGAVAVLAVPSSLDSPTSPATRQLAEDVAERLRSAGFDVVVAGATDTVPLEELIATENASRVDVTLGLESLGDSEGCAAILLPTAIEKPVALRGEREIQLAELNRYVTQLMASSRFRASARLASAMTSVGDWCKRAPSEAEQYVLEEALAPTLVISVGSADSGVLAKRMPPTVRGWLMRERQCAGRTTRRCS
jgi:hypothetical protein